MMGVLVAHDDCAFSADSLVGCRGQRRRAMLEGTSRTVWRFRRYKGFCDLLGYFSVADFWFGLLATSDFRCAFQSSRGARISRRSLGFCCFEAIFDGKHG